MVLWAEACLDALVHEKSHLIDYLQGGHSSLIRLAPATYRKPKPVEVAKPQLANIVDDGTIK